MKDIFSSIKDENTGLKTVKNAPKIPHISPLKADNAK
jgi:hypothetical protein